MSETTHCGYVAIIGQPNVGKSTLLNQILGQKISITSRKPQTTRQQLLGVKTSDNPPVIYVDTPGLHKQNKNALNRYMNRAASGVINTVNVIAFMGDAGHWGEDDNWVLNKLSSVTCPVILVVNKIDKLGNNNEALPLMEEYGSKFEFAAVIPMSAKDKEDVEQFETEIDKLLPSGPAKFPEDQITDKSMRFLAAEIVREKIMRLTGAEIPYSVALEIEEYKEKENIIHIGVVILVDKKTQKAIIIGKKGALIKEIGTQARRDLEKMLDSKVFLRLWVKVREGWADDERALSSLGYGE